VVGDNRRQAQDGTNGYHGAAVLGLLLSPDNGKGVAGIAPHVARRRTASHYVAASADPGHVANAIQALTPGSSTDDPMKVLSPGDVLLLEVQRGSADFQTNPFFPTEIDAADHRAIQAAVAQGIIVIEAAGNSNCDLDAPGKMPALDSGAILVGAANSGVSQVGNGDPFHLRAEFSNFGQRVHCYGWGDSVVTCGFGTLKPSGSPPVIPDTQTYANDFDGTSAAAALVAGAVVLIQSYYQTKNGRPLTPTEMRGVLTDSQLGTPHGSRTAIAENIGRMPDLKKIFEAIDRGDF
jgi:subtilisin family serine protease